MDIEHELRAMDQARMTTDGIHFDSIEGQVWLNRVFQERLDEKEVELFDTGALKKEETPNKPAISSFVPPNLETCLGAVPAVTIYKPQSAIEPGHRMDVQDRLGEARLGEERSTLDEIYGLSTRQRKRPAPLDRIRDQRRRAPVERSEVQTGAI